MLLPCCAVSEVHPAAAVVVVAIVPHSERDKATGKGQQETGLAEEMETSGRDGDVDWMLKGDGSEGG
jgi:hypothetical protein